MAKLDRAWFKGVADAVQAFELSGAELIDVQAVLAGRAVRPPADAFEAAFVRGLWSEVCLRRLAESSDRARAPDPTSPGTAWSADVCRAVLAIDELACTERLRRRDVARLLGVSESWLSHTLKATGLNFWEHVHLARIDEATRLLLETSLSVKEVAASVGYTTTDLVHQFSARFGIAPGAWRARAAGRARALLSARDGDG